MDDADRPLYLPNLLRCAAEWERVGLLRDVEMSRDRHAAGQCRTARNQSGRTPSLPAEYFTSIKMKSSKRWMANSGFIAKLFSNRRLDGGIKLEGILQCLFLTPRYREFGRTCRSPCKSQRVF